MIKANQVVAYSTPTFPQFVIGLIATCTNNMRPVSFAFAPHNLSKGRTWNFVETHHFILAFASRICLQESMPLLISSWSSRIGHSIRRGMMENGPDSVVQRTTVFLLQGCDGLISVNVRVAHSNYFGASDVGFCSRRRAYHRLAFVR